MVYLFYGGQILDFTRVRAEGAINTFGGEASGSAAASGDARSETTYLLHQASTSTDGSAAIEGTAEGPASLFTNAHVGSANYLDGLTDLIADFGFFGTFDTNTMSVSSIGILNLEGVGAGGSVKGEAEAGGDTEAEGAYNDGVVIANTETSADGSVSGSGGMQVSAEIAGVAAAGDWSTTPYINPVAPVLEFTAADSGLMVTGACDTALIKGSNEGMASGKAEAEADQTSPARTMASESDAQAKLLIQLR
jgi:hypothetical protein